MQRVYARWQGRAVTLQVATDELRVPLQGVIVGETDSTLRFRIGECWDIDVFKNMILSIEECCEIMNQ